jgi:hypothetical protein
MLSELRFGVLDLAVDEPDRRVISIEEGSGRNGEILVQVIANFPSNSALQLVRPVGEPTAVRLACHRRVLAGRWARGNRAAGEEPEAREHGGVNRPRHDGCCRKVRAITQDEPSGPERPSERVEADFTGISDPSEPRDRLFIDKVLHKGTIRIDEKGTEAAAATAVGMVPGGGVPPTDAKKFIADHPFLFILRDADNGAILFLGRVASP